MTDSNQVKLNIFCKKTSISKTELEIILSIISACVISLGLLTSNSYLRSVEDNTNFSEFISSSGLWFGLLWAEATSFLGIWFILENTIGLGLIASWISQGNLMALLGLISLYAPASIVIISTRKSIPLGRKWIYSYLSATQFSLLAFILYTIFNNSNLI